MGLATVRTGLQRPDLGDRRRRGGAGRTPPAVFRTGDFADVAGDGNGSSGADWVRPPPGDSSGGRDAGAAVRAIPDGAGGTNAAALNAPFPHHLRWLSGTLCARRRGPQRWSPRIAGVHGLTFLELNRRDQARDFRANHDRFISAQGTNRRHFNIERLTSDRNRPDRDGLRFRRLLLSGNNDRSDQGQLYGAERQRAFQQVGHRQFPNRSDIRETAAHP
jgi:hypothetical protein